MCAFHGHTYKFRLLWWNSGNTKKQKKKTRSDKQAEAWGLGKDKFDYFEQSGGIDGYVSFLNS